MNYTLTGAMLLAFLLFVAPAYAQQPLRGTLTSTSYGSDITITVDWPDTSTSTQFRNSRIIFYALPNGNNTAQTMGKAMKAGDDWHYDIQHIRAQTAFLRKQLPRQRIVLVYLENSYLSWPKWKSVHADHALLARNLVDSLRKVFAGWHPAICLNGHSGGGRFLFSYLDGISEIPDDVERLSFLDSDYGYDSTYFSKMENWLHRGRGHYLTVFAYNDSVALYNGKPVVSATGGTWYRSHRMMNDLAQSFRFTQIRNDSITVYRAQKGRIQFLFRQNPDRKIYHTQQVELNGFIHSLLAGTKQEERGYRYYGERAYRAFIR